MPRNVRRPGPACLLLAPIIGLIVFALPAVGCDAPAVPATASPPLPAVPSVTPWPTSTPAPPVLVQPPAAPEPSPTPAPLPPPPGHPTALPLPPTPDIEAQLAGAQVDINARPAAAAVGELITLTGRPTNLGLPQYTLYLRGEPATVIRYDGEVIFQGFTGAEVELVAASASQSEAIFTLRATQPGQVAAMISVSGEVRLDANQGPTTGFAWSSASSSTITLMIAAPAQPQPDSSGASPQLNVTPTTGPAGSTGTIQPNNAVHLTKLARLGKGTIHDFAWLPGESGQLLAGAPLGLHIYLAGTHNEARFMPTGSPVMAVAVSPDGALVAAAQENFIQLWSLVDGAPRQILSEHSGPVLRLAFSPDGRWLASGSADGTLRLWDVVAGQARYVWPFTPGGRFIFSADHPPGEKGRWLAVGGGKWNRQVQVYDLTTGQLAAALDILPDLTGLAFSPDGRKLAVLPSGESPTPVLLWDFQTGQTRRLVDNQAIRSVSFNPTGATLATGSLDGAVRLWTIADGQSQLLGQHSAIALNLTFSPNGQWLASADETRLKVWDVNAKTLRFDLEQFAVRQLHFSPDGRTLAFQRGGTVGLLDLHSGQFDLLPGHSDLIASLAFDSGSQILATGDWSGLIQLWDAATGQPLRVLDGHAGPVGHLAFSPVAPVLASGGINEDTLAHLWEVNTGRQLDTISGDAGYPLADLSFSPDGGVLAFGGLNGVILRDVTTGAIRRLGGHSQPVLSVAFSPNGQRLASGSFDDPVIIWDVSAGQPLRTLPGHNLGTAALVFSPDGQWLITGDQQDHIRGWSVDNGQLLQTIAGRGQDLALGPDGTLLAYKPTVDTIALWDIAGKREVFRDTGERPLAFSPNGRVLAAGATDGVVTLWGIK